MQQQSCKLMYKFVRNFLLLSVVISLLTSCSSSPLTKESPSSEQPQLLSNDDFVEIPLTSYQNSKFVSASEFLQTMQYTTLRLDGKNELLVGDHDPIYKFVIDSTQALAEGKPIRLTTPLTKINGQLHFPLEAITEVFGQDMNYSIMMDRLVLHATENKNLDSWSNGEEAYQFAEQSSTGTMKMQATDATSIIQTAKQYLGVKYEFGADPYPSSNRFDCSSFLQHVFDKYGIDLPRVARSQADRGTTVSRKNLQIGDLLFFSVPGRFKSDDVIGHCGIYIGGGKMIHASPEPENGVQISDIHNSHWENTFITAKRILS